MRVVLVLAVLLACVGAALAAPGDNLNMMSPEEQFAYQQYIQQLQGQDFRTNPFQQDTTPFATSAYDSLDQMDVNCPSSTFGLTIPPRHVRFWKSYPLTQGLGWSAIKSENVKVLCVPERIKFSIAPLVEKVSTERMINVDPLTVPQFVNLADKIVKKTIITQQQLQQLPINQNQQTSIDDMETQGFHGGLGWGRGFGWGGLGWGGLGGWGYPGFGFSRLGWGYPGFGFGYGGLGYGGLGWGYPGVGFGLAL